MRFSALLLVWLAFSAQAQITVDLHQTFETDTLNTTNLDANDNFATTGRWSITDANTKLSTSAECERAYPGTIGDVADTGTRGLSYDANGGAQAYLSFAHPAQRTQLSGGFSVKVIGAAFFGSFGEYDLSRSSTDLGVDPSLTKIVDDTNETRFHAFVPSDYSTGIAILENTWYWVTWKHVKNDTFLVTLLDENWEQVGDEQSLAVGNENLTEFLFGPFVGGPDVDSTICFDDMLLDWTNAAYPIVPMESGESAGPAMSTNFIDSSVPGTAVYLRGTAHATDGSGRYVRACETVNVFLAGVGHTNDGATCIDPGGDIAYELGGWALTAAGEVAAEECEPEYYVNGIPRDGTTFAVCMTEVN